MALIDKDYPFFGWDRYLKISVHILVDLQPLRVSGGRVYKSQFISRPRGGLVPDPLLEGTWAGNLIENGVDRFIFSTDLFKRLFWLAWETHIGIGTVPRNETDLAVRS